MNIFKLFLKFLVYLPPYKNLYPWTKSETCKNSFGFGKKKIGSGFQYQKWTLVLVPNTETWFRSYTNWLNPKKSFSWGVLGTEFVVPFSSHCCSLAFKSSIFWIENIIIWVRTLPYFTQWFFFHPIPLFEWKKVLFDDIFVTTWEQENKNERK